MKVSYCEKCKCYERRKWSDYYVPKNYHPIGMSHAYGYCRLLCMRCSEIKPYVCPKKRYADGMVVKSGIFDENI